jgi:endonuclease YncB( thermonuclease family)
MRERFLNVFNKVNAIAVGLPPQATSHLGQPKLPWVGILSARATTSPVLAGYCARHRLCYRGVCYDGDTCRAASEILPGRDRIRLANADTPEIEGKCQEEIERAIQARDYTRALVVGRTVILTAVEPDKYDKRVDAYVRLPDGRDLGDALIAAGLARPYSGGHRDGWCR